MRRAVKEGSAFPHTMGIGRYNPCLSWLPAIHRYYGVATSVVGFLGFVGRGADMLNSGSVVERPRSAAETECPALRAQCSEGHPAAPLPSSLSNILMREMTHRINNEFASAMSMVSLAAMRSKSAEATTILAQVIDLL